MSQTESTDNNPKHPAVGVPLELRVSPRSHDVAALFCRADSVYKTLPGVDVWDIDRDARRWTGGCPVVAHPPCRAWGRLRHFAKPRADEMDLARWAVAQVRRWGGVLEHPASSILWADQGLPRIGARTDPHGGWATGVHQWDFGHRAEKATWLYIVGCAPRDLPVMPIQMGEPTHVVQTSARGPARPPELAVWLVELARRCHVRANFGRLSASAPM